MSIEIEADRITEIEKRFLEFFDEKHKDYLGALGYFHSLRTEEEREHLKRQPQLSVILDEAIDNVTYGVYRK